MDGETAVKCGSFNLQSPNLPCLSLGPAFLLVLPSWFSLSTASLTFLRKVIVGIIDTLGIVLII